MSDISRILVIDDEKNYLVVMEALLKDAGYEVTALNDPEMALHFLDESEVDVVITDMKMPKLSGKEVLQRIKKSWPDLPVLIMTAFGSIENAVEAMRYGAFDYITKPFANDELLLSVHNAVELSKAHRQYRLLQESLEERYRTHHIIGKSKAIRNTLSIVDRVAVSRSTVLITGESGTGKELVARAIHFSSPARKAPSYRLTVWHSMPECWKASCSAMKRAPLPEPWLHAEAALSRPTTGLYFLMKWVNSAWTCRLNFSGYCRKEYSNA